MNTKKNQYPKVIKIAATYFVVWDNRIINKITDVRNSKKNDREKINLLYCTLGHAHTKTGIKLYSSFRMFPKSQ